MLEFLSDDWLAALGAALTSLPPAAAGPSLSLGQIVTGVPGRPGGELHYTIVLDGPAGDEMIVGTTEHADVVLVTSYEDAADLVRGAMTASRLLELGRVKIRGDAIRVADSAGQIERAAAATALLSDRTTVAGPAST